MNTRPDFTVIPYMVVTTAVQNCNIYNQTRCGC